MGTKAVESEARIQSQAVTRLKNSRLDLRRRIFAITNNSQNDIKGAQNKAMGVTRGVSDTCFIASCGRSIWIEWKLDNTDQSNDQILWQEEVERLGHIYVTVRSEEEFLTVIHFYEN